MFYDITDLDEFEKHNVRLLFYKFILNVRWWSQGDRGKKSKSNSKQGLEKASSFLSLWKKYSDISLQ